MFPPKIPPSAALRHRPALLQLIWQTSPALTLGSVALRLVRALVPLATQRQQIERGSERKRRQALQPEAARRSWA